MIENDENMFLSFIIPTYNRKNLVQETIDSIINTEFNIKYEIIVIDDCSFDNTIEFLKNKYLEKLEAGIFQYHFLEENIGVTGAKNYGVIVAKGKWVVFLDSDDLFIKESKNNFLKELYANENCGVVFFRRNTFDGNLLGKEFEENVYYNFDKYMTLGFPGECLPVVKKDVALKFPYEQKLRGFENIAYFRILKNNVTVLVSRIVARKYRTDNEDRLSNLKGKLKRAKQFYDGYRITLNEYKDIDYSVSYGLRIRVIAYFFLRYIASFIR